MEQTNSSDSKRSALPRLLVLASTFPRWLDDDEPAFVYELCKRLTDQYEVHVLAPHALHAKHQETMGSIIVHRFQYAPLPLQQLTYDGGILARIKQRRWRLLLVPGFICTEGLALRRLLKTYKFDAIHSHWIIPQTLAVRLGCLGMRKTPPLLVTSHGSDLFGLQGKLMTWLKRWALQKCQYITVVSKPMVAEATKLAPKKPIDIIPMGTCLNTCFTLNHLVERKTKTLLFVGRLVEKKGVFILLEAMSKVKASHQDVNLWIVGKGPDEKKMRQRAAQNDLQGNVLFLGSMSQKKIAGLYQQTTMTVLPSIQEGFGLVIVEAMGCGSPVIVSGLPAIEDIVTDEQIAIKVPPGDIGALAQAICTTLNDPVSAQERAIEARKHTLSRFDWDNIANQYKKILTKIIKDNSIS